jgi:hypothetical protein
VLLGVEEEAPSDMMTMTIWLIENLVMKSNGDGIDREETNLGAICLAIDRL